jgi:hypothetical protein
MRGALALSAGVVFVARRAGRALLELFDLDGRRISRAQLACEPAAAGAPAGVALAPAALAVDGERRAWVAAPEHGGLVAFNVFGARVAAVAGREEARDPARPPRGALAAPAALAAVVDGSSTGALLWVASGGRRIEAVALVDEGAGTRARLASTGAPGEPFENVTALALLGAELWVGEARGRIQIFRGERFSRALALAGVAEDATLRALAPLPDGGALVALAGESGGLVRVARDGAPIARLARAGAGAGELVEPEALVVDHGAGPSRARVFVLDRGATRLQAFDLDGACRGSFAELERDLAG